MSPPCAGTSGCGWPFGGQPTALGEQAGGALPLAFGLEPNYPNPFNSTTVLHFTVAAAAPARLAIHNSLGQLVHLLVDEPLAAGRYRVQWAGLVADGSAAASGVYFARLTAGADEARQSMILLK